jgi:hypothetical protein
MAPPLAAQLLTAGSSPGASSTPVKLATAGIARIDDWLADLEQALAAM